MRGVRELPVTCLPCPRQAGSKQAKLEIGNQSDINLWLKAPPETEE